VGGIKINSNTEALNKNDEPVPGLYASGNCAGGMYGDTYDAVTSGLTMSFAISSGRIASENALKYIGK
jgi:fumarate reductase flavoprotein subunit